MATHPVRPISDELGTDITFKGLLEECGPGGAIKTLSALEAHTERQRNWYKGVCLAYLSDKTGYTEDEMDMRIKAECGSMLKKEAILLGYQPDGKPLVYYRPTITGVGKRKMADFITNVLAASVTHEWGLPHPDPELRSK